MSCTQPITTAEEGEHRRCSQKCPGATLQCAKHFHSPAKLSAQRRMHRFMEKDEVYFTSSLGEGKQSGFHPVPGAAIVLYS